MISINSRGQVCHGTGGGWASIDNVAFSRGGAMGWIDDDTVAFASGEVIIGGEDWAACRRPASGSITPLSNPPSGANVGYAGGGHAAWWWGKGKDPVTQQPLGGLYSTTGLRLPEAGLMGMGPDGSLAYKANYQSNGPTLVRELSGEIWMLTPNHAYSLQMLGGRQAVLADSVLGLTFVNMPKPLVLMPGGTSGHRAAYVNDQWWIAYYSERRAQIVLHPFNELVGYVVSRPGDAWFNVRALDFDTVYVPWSSKEGEQPGEMTLGASVTFNVTTRPREQLFVEASHTDAPHADAPVPPKPPAVVKPKVTVLAWDALMKAGVPWHVKFKTGAQDTVDVSKDAQDHLVIAAWNDAGTDTTGTVRQLTVEGADTPEPPNPEPPEPPMRVTARCWMHPNIGSKDLLALFDDVTQLASVEMFGLYVQSILSDQPTTQLGENIWPNLVAHDVVKKLADAGIDLRVEMGCVKQGDCDAQNNIGGMQTMLQRVADAGGHVATISLDEPLTANQQFCGGDLARCADAHAAFDHSVKAIDPSVTVGWVEAWPEVDLDDWVTYLALLADRNALPSYVLPDVDHHRAQDERKNVEWFFAELQRLCDQYGITLGCLVNATVDPLPTDQAHHENLLALSDTLYSIIPDAAHVVVQSWANRTGGTQDIPHNLGTFGLLATFAAVRDQFIATPIPTPPGDDMLYATLIEPTKERGPVVVKEVKPVQGEKGVYTLILPDDKVFSMIPTGADGEQVPGTQGPYEKCTVSGNAATFRPEPDKVFTRFFALVAGL